MAEIVLTDSNFDAEVLQSAGTVLVDFWAPWCGPCRMLAPAVAQIAEEYEGRVKVGKVNVDDAPALAARYGVMSIPTVMVFRGGEAVHTLVGLRPKAELEALLK
ncbi:MAG: thioredoxin [Oscillospiraceae bacterium]|nr:thioredoxin [Oscillospiraceae bacterium]